MGPEPKNNLRSGARARARARFLLCRSFVLLIVGGHMEAIRPFLMSFSTLTLLVSKKDICPFCKEPIGCYKRTYVLSEVDAE